MEQLRIPASMEVIDFRSLVKECAQEPGLVAAFNRACGAQLRAPIAALLDDRWPMSVAEEEQLIIGCFIVFVHENIWTRLQRAPAVTGWRLDVPEVGQVTAQLL